VSFFTALFGRGTDVRRPDDPIWQVGACSSIGELGGFLDHRSGYVREAAVARAVSLRGPGAVPAVMLRLNDYVPEVRAAARRAVQTLLPFAGHDDLLACLGFTWRLRHFSRVDHSAWISDVQRELAARLSAAQLLAALRSNNPMVARGSFFLLLEREIVPRAQLLMLAIESANDIVMARQAAHLLTSLPIDDRIVALRAGLGSRFGVVRTYALRGLLECAPDAPDIARNALLDKQGSTRSSAQFFLKQQGVDLASYYRAVLLDDQAKAHVSCMAIAALGSMGDAADLALIRERAASQSASIRGAAYQAWLKLAPSDKDAIALAALSDDSRANRKFAAGLAMRQGAFIPFEQVKHVLQGKPDFAVLLAFARIGKWDWLETLAIAETHLGPDSTGRNMLVREMQHWLRHAGQTYERPGTEQRGRLLSPELVQAMERLCGRYCDVLHYELGLFRHVE